MVSFSAAEFTTLIVGAVVIAVASYVYGLSSGIEKERKKHE